MKAVPLILIDGGYDRCEPSEATHIRLHLPGPLPDRILPVILSGSRGGTSCWTWNGSTDHPTIKPSILTKGGSTSDVCHSWVSGGLVQFLNDCSHEFAGMTMDLLEVEE